MSSRQNRLSKEQVEQLEQLREIPHDEVQKRVVAILELNQGDSLRTVAQNSDVAMSTVSRWWKSWEADGVQGFPKYLREIIKIFKEAQAYRDLSAVDQELIDVPIDILKRFQSLLPVIDDFDRAFENLPEDLSESSWVESIFMIRANFEKWLGKCQIEAIDPVAGDRFDPNFHQTIGTDDSDEVESGHVTETLRKGYQASEIVLRDALVRIAR